MSNRGVNKTSIFNRFVKKELKRKHIGLIFGVAMFVFSLLTGITNVSVPTPMPVSISGPTTSPLSPTTILTTTATIVLTPVETLEEKVIQILGEKTNTGETKIRAITAGNDIITIDFMADENLTINLTRRGIWTDITDLLKKLLSQIDPKIESLTFQAYFPLADQYGQVSIDKVMLITVAKETWNKINWNNFLKENLPKIADDYWEHPALSK